MSANTEIQIKAIWTNYGPRYHHAGKNTDCVSNHDSWTLAAYDLEKWLERNHPGKTPVFCGSSAKCAQEGWKEWNR